MTCPGRKPNNLESGPDPSRVPYALLPSHAFFSTIKRGCRRGLPPKAKPSHIARQPEATCRQGFQCRLYMSWTLRMGNGYILYIKLTAWNPAAGVMHQPNTRQPFFYVPAGAVRSQRIRLGAAGTIGFDVVGLRRCAVTTKRKGKSEAKRHTH